MTGRCWTFNVTRFFPPGLMSASCLMITSAAAQVDRPGLAKALAFLRPGDCLVVWKLDRLGRSLPHLLATVNDLKSRGVAFRSLTEQMDTTTPQGEFLFHVFGALAQFERSLDPGAGEGQASPPPGGEGGEEVARAPLMPRNMRR